MSLESYSFLVAVYDLVNLCLTIRITVGEIEQRNGNICLSDLNARPAVCYSPNDSQNKRMKTSYVDVLVLVATTRRK